MPRVSILIVNYNAGDRLLRCLEALTHQTMSDFEVIIFDNASSDGSENIETSEVVKKLSLKVIRSPANLGFAAGNNRAAEHAHSDWLAFLNPDAYAAPDWLEQLLTATERYSGADAFGSTQLDAAKPDQIDGAGDVYHIFGIPYRGGFGRPIDTLPSKNGECFAPCAAAALYRRSVFERLGGFEELFFCYGEDVDLGFRLRLAGGRAIQVRKAVVHHEGSGITGRHSDFTIYHGHRNRLWTYYRNMPAPLLIAFLPFHMAVNAYLLGRFVVAGGASAYLRAIRDGFLGLSNQTHARRQIQRQRKASLADIAKALTWSPIKVFRRAADLRQIYPTTSLAAKDKTA